MPRAPPPMPLVDVEAECSDDGGSEAGAGAAADAAREEAERGVLEAEAEEWRGRTPPDSPSSDKSPRAHFEHQLLRHTLFEDFCNGLGVFADAFSAEGADAVEMVAARHLFAAPLPPEWSEYWDKATQTPYFYDRLHRQSTWTHPQDHSFRELLAEVRQWSPDSIVEEVVARSDFHLRAARASAATQICCWTGPHAFPDGGKADAASSSSDGPRDADAEGAHVATPQAEHFYHNQVTGESRWVDPRLSLELDLLRRHAVLSECVAAHARAVERRAVETIAARRRERKAAGACRRGRGDRDDASDSEDGTSWAPLLQLPWKPCCRNRRPRPGGVRAGAGERQARHSEDAVPRAPAVGEKAADRMLHRAPLPMLLSMHSPMAEAWRLCQGGKAAGKAREAAPPSPSAGSSTSAGSFRTAASAGTPRSQAGAAAAGCPQTCGPPPCLAG